MKITGFSQFASEFGRAAKNTMNTSIYRDRFECACGNSHWFDESARIICQGAGMKLMIQCPSNDLAVTSVKIKTVMVFKFKGFECLSGGVIKNEEDAVLFGTIRSMFR